MGYKTATRVLPQELLEKIQEYVDGEYIYIPRTADNRKSWGAATSTRKELEERNARIYEDYLTGASMESLAEAYFLSLKSIQRIIGQWKKNRMIENGDRCGFETAPARFFLPLSYYVGYRLFFGGDMDGITKKSTL